MEYPNIFDYLDYRAFLKDMFEYRKQQIKHFSYRFFARKSGFKSPNFLKLVATGKRNLTNESIAKVSKGFELKKQEREFFENLVFMNQASKHEQKNHYYKKMMSVKGYNAIKKIDKKSYEYFSKWYHPVIRELLLLGKKNQNAEEIAPVLNPPITVKEAEKALTLLVALGLIKKRDDGQWEQKDQDISTGPEVQSLIIANYHREMLDMASQSIERFEAEERDITALVLSINHEHMEKLKKKTAAFRKELLELASEEENPDQVIQVNIQVFPLTKNIGGEK